MKFKFSVFNLSIATSFALAFICLLFSYLTPIMYYPALVLFCVSFILLSINFIISYIKNQKIYQEKQDAIIMELAMGEDGEKYVMQDPKQAKKQNKKNRTQNFERLSPTIVALAFSCLFLYLLVSSIIKLF